MALRWHQVDLKAGLSRCPSGEAGTPRQTSPARPATAAAAGTPAHLPRLAVCVRVRAQGAPVATLDSRDRRESRQIGRSPFVPHPHQLRHACGYYLASRGHDTRAIQDYLGKETSSILCATPRWRPTDLKVSGRIKTYCARCMGQLSMRIVSSQGHCQQCCSAHGCVFNTRHNVILIERYRFREPNAAFCITPIT